MYANPPLGAVYTWRHAFHWSFSRLNEITPEAGTLLDLGGGDGSLYRFILPPINYTLLDKNEESLRRAIVPSKVEADATKTPFADNSFDLIVSVSTMQYIDHESLLDECARLLRPGGYLALHENGTSNPFIWIARRLSRVIALGAPAIRTYNSTIQKYCDYPSVRHNQLIMIAERSFGLLSPLAFILECMGFRQIARMIEPKLVKLDQILFKSRLLRQLAWFRVFHLAKPAGRNPNH